MTRSPIVIRDLLLFPVCSCYFDRDLLNALGYTGVRRWCVATINSWSQPRQAPGERSEANEPDTEWTNRSSTSSLINGISINARFSRTVAFNAPWSLINCWPPVLSHVLRTLTDIVAWLYYNFISLETHLFPIRYVLPILYLYIYINNIILIYL